MPIYEYECSQCGKKFELRRTLNNINTSVKCPQCGAERSRKLFSVFATNQSNDNCTSTGST